MSIIYYIYNIYYYVYYIYLFFEMSPQNISETTTYLFTLKVDRLLL